MLLALVAGAGFRSTTGALFEPLESEFGWTRSATSLAVTPNLVVYGLTAPFAAALVERAGIKRVVLAGLALTAVGSGLTVLMTDSHAAAWTLAAVPCWFAAASLFWLRRAPRSEEPREERLPVSRPPPRRLPPPARPGGAGATAKPAPGSVCGPTASVRPWSRC